MPTPTETIRDHVAALLSTADDSDRWWLIADIADALFGQSTEADRQRIRNIVNALHADGLVELTLRASARAIPAGPQWGGYRRQPDRGMYRSSRKVLHVRWADRTSLI